MSKIRVALVSPSANATSETFIQAHKHGLEAQVFHYHNGFLPKELEGKGRLQQFDILSRLKRKMGGDSGFDPDQAALLDSFSTNKIQVVLAEYGPTGAMLTPICKELNIPLIVHFHGYDASQFDIVEKYKQGYLEMFSYASSIVGVSKMMVKMLRDLGAPSEKLVYAPCSPSPSFYSVEHHPVQPFEFLFVGRFVDKKAPYYLVLAFKKLIDEGLPARLNLAGEGPLLNTTRNLVKALGLQDQVSFLGAVGHETVLDLMGRASCYLQHSIRAESGDMEGTPVAVMEAAASGLPVIATRHAGIPDVILDGATGLLVDEHDVEAMSDHMISLVRKPEEARRLGSLSRSHMEAEMNLDESASILNELIRKAVN